MAEMYVQIATRHGLWMFPLMMLALGVLLSLFVLFRKKAKSVEEHLQRVKDMLERTHSNYTLEENVNRFLELVAELIDAPTYAFYMIDKKNRGYVLKAVRYEAKDFGDVRPSYSGLASFQEGTYRPPISLPGVEESVCDRKNDRGRNPAV